MLALCYRHGPNQGQRKNLTRGRFSKVTKTFHARKAISKPRSTYSVALALSYVVNEWKIKIIVKFCASRCYRFEDTKGIMSPEIRPKRFGTFEKQSPGQICGMRADS